MVADKNRVLPHKVLTGFGGTVLLLLGFAQVYFIAWRTHRFTVGISGPLNYPTGAGWRPPLPTALLLIGFTSAVGAAAWGLHRKLDGAATEVCEPDRAAG